MQAGSVWGPTTAWVAILVLACAGRADGTALGQAKFGSGCIRARAVPAGFGGSGRRLGNAGESGGPALALLRLRGGGLLDCFGCFRCIGSEDSRTAAPDSEGGKAARKRKIGRVERGPVIINAPIQKVYTVITDFDHYCPDWAGDGIKKMKYVQRTPKFCEINYVTGEYRLKKVGKNQTEVYFVITADILAPIPDFVKMAIANLICDIAVFWLQRYVESAECDKNLRKYGLWPPNAHGWRQRVTQLMTNAGTQVTMGVIDGIMNLPPLSLARSLVRRSLRLLRNTVLGGIKLVVKFALMSAHHTARAVQRLHGKGGDSEHESHDGEAGGGTLEVSSGA